MYYRSMIPNAHYRSMIPNASLHYIILKFRYDQRATIALESHGYAKLNVTVLDKKELNKRRMRYLEMLIEH